MALCELWVLADKLSMPKLQNCALKKLEMIDGLFPGCIEYVYSYTQDGSLLRQFLVRQCVNNLDSSELYESYSTSPLTLRAN